MAGRHRGLPGPWATAAESRYGPELGSPSHPPGRRQEAGGSAGEAGALMRSTLTVSRNLQQLRDGQLITKAQDQGRTANRRHPASRPSGYRRPSRLVHRPGPGRPGHHRREGRPTAAPRAAEALGSSTPGRRPARPSHARPPPYREYLGGRLGSLDPGTDGPDGARHTGRGAALPARHRRPGRCHRPCTLRVRQTGRGGAHRPGYEPTLLTRKLIGLDLDRVSYLHSAFKNGL